MKGTRQRQKDRGKENFLSAIDRIVEGRPTCKELKTTKLNKLNVELEAGTSVGALRNYPIVTDFIKVKKTNPSAIYSDDGNFIDNVSGDIIPQANVLEEKEIQIHNLREEHKKEKDRANDYMRQQKNTNEAMDNQLAKHHSLTVALFNNVPADTKERLMRAHENNVRTVNFKPS